MLNNVVKGLVKTTEYIWNYPGVYSWLASLKSWDYTGLFLGIIYIPGLYAWTRLPCQGIVGEHYSC